MTIKCPICGAEYKEGTVRFCTICMYSIGSDPYLTNLLNHPSEGDLKVYNDSIVEYRTLWRERNPENKRDDPGSIEMIEVEGGAFNMGSNDGEWDEKPVHQVTVGSFMIGKYSITQQLWENIMGSNSSRFRGRKRPVEMVSWYDAVEFCNKLSEEERLAPAYKIGKTREDPNNKSEYDNLKWFVTCDFNANGYRLPTEAEWEYAARGGNKSKGYTYSGSNNLDEVGWYGAESNSGNRTKEEATSEVGKKKPNELGIYDMSGNVMEWCWDWYDKNYYSTGSQTNPRGPSSGSRRVYRGGGWRNHAVSCRVAIRNLFTPVYRYYLSLGFRVVRTKI